MKTVPLKANQRNGVGKQEVKKIRSQKRIPAVVYGHGIKPTALDVGVDDFLRAIHTKAGENVIIQLSVAGSKGFEKTVVIKEVQHHPVTEAVVHIDFNAISLTEKIKVKVPLHVKGEAPGTKEGGILDVVHHEIEVECLPTHIPERLDADISDLKIGDSIHIRELEFPSGVTPQLSEDEVVVAIHAPKVEEVAQPEEALNEPEVIGKKEKAEGEEA
ncbi:MAG: 50S ribosomal protein L25, partial [Candidatus Omnitrophica bacterium]|nr:50S ribosomal protein L25 [Candidatus Omnitrophota bacterium]